MLNGRCLFDADKSLNLAPEARRVGYIFQDGRLFPHLSVRANLTYGMRLVPKAKQYVTFDQVVELLGIASLLKRRPARLSGGKKQRVAPVSAGRIRKLLPVCPERMCLPVEKPCAWPTHWAEYYGKNSGLFPFCPYKKRRQPNRVRPLPACCGR